MIARLTRVKYGLVATSCLVVVVVGCAPTRTSSRTRIHTISEGTLDECREVALSYDVLQEREGTQPERKYEQLILRIYPRKHLSYERTLKSVEMKPGVPSGQLRIESAEARIDQAREKVWFVEPDTSRILATLDLQTGRTTGPDDEPPAWATPDGGMPLEPATDWVPGTHE
jgi:hypothetical protein